MIKTITDPPVMIKYTRIRQTSSRISQVRMFWQIYAMSSHSRQRVL